MVKTSYDPSAGTSMELSLRVTKGGVCDDDGGGDDAEGASVTEIEGFSLIGCVC